MVRRVVLTARHTGVSPEGQALVAWACQRALAPREHALADDHDPDYLHPGRSALILLQDTGELNPVLLAAAALTESRRPELRTSDRGALEGCPPELRALLEQALALRSEIPESGDPRLLERLVAAPAAVRRVALAEGLDHVRHAHMWTGPRNLPAVLDEVESVWEPLARRTHELLTRRFERWKRATGRRIRRGGST